MKYKRIVLLFALSFVVLPLSAFINTQWIHVSYASGKHYGSMFSDRQSEGYDFGYILIVPYTNVGLSARVATTHSTEAKHTSVLLAPVYRKSLLGLLEGFFLFGPSYTQHESKDDGSLESQIGLGMGLGLRIPFASAIYGNLALIAGASGDLSLVRLINNESAPAFAGNLTYSVGLAYNFNPFYRLPLAP